MIALDHQSLASGFISDPYFIIYEIFSPSYICTSWPFIPCLLTFWINLPVIILGIHAVRLFAVE